MSGASSVIALLQALHVVRGRGGCVTAWKSLTNVAHCFHHFTNRFGISYISTMIILPLNFTSTLISFQTWTILFGFLNLLLQLLLQLELFLFFVNKLLESCIGSLRICRCVQVTLILLRLVL